MIKTSVSLQELRAKIYLKVKSDLAGTGGVVHGLLPGLKALPVNRSHKPLGETDKKAQFGKSERWV
jgi:hypothetical protein